MASATRPSPARLLAVLTPYAIAPARHGPQIRVAGILKNLGPDWNVVHFSQSIQRTDLPWPPKSVRGGEQWIEYRLRDPISAAWLLGLNKLGGYPAAYADRLLEWFPRPAITGTLARADAVLVSPHYQFSWVRRHTPKHTGIVVDSYSIEAEVWAPRKARWTKAVWREIRDSEINAWRQADMVFTTHAREAEVAKAAGAAAVTIVPNGVDVERFRPASPDERAQTKAVLGLAVDQLVAVFVGAASYPNINATDILVHQADEYAQAGIHLVVVGRVGSQRAPVRNITWTGEVADVSTWLRAADLCLCPLTVGSGTSLKSLEYLASGLPVVSTEVGVRGLGVQSGVHAIVCDADSMPFEASRLVQHPKLRAALGAAARRLAEDQFSWSAIGHVAAEALERLARKRERATSENWDSTLLEGA